MVGVKTSLRRPCYLSKKKEIWKRPLSENLSEALKADGKGENLIEAPLLSFKKKEKKKKKKQERQRQQVYHVKLHADCRCSMEERKPLNSKPRVLIMQSGHLTSTSSKNTHFLQGMCTISSWQTFYRKMQTFYRKVQTFLQETQLFYNKVLYFYRKPPVEVREGPEFILWGYLTTKGRFGRMQATVVTLIHCCHLFLPSLSTCNQVTCTIKEDQWVIKRKAIFEIKKNAEMSYHLHPSHPWALWVWSWG